MLSDQGKRLQAHKRALRLAAMAPAKEKDFERGAAAAYDAQGPDLLTKTRKIISASNRAIEAEAVLRRR